MIDRVKWEKYRDASQSGLRDMVAQKNDSIQCLICQLVRSSWTCMRVHWGLGIIREVRRRGRGALPTIIIPSTCKGQRTANLGIHTRECCASAVVV